MNNAAVVFDDKREENLKEKLAEERKEKAAYTLYWERQIGHDFRNFLKLFFEVQKDIKKCQDFS